MSENFKMSVVVATYNRADTIAMTLHCLNKQTLNPSQFEIIVVDDGSKDNTEEVVLSMQSSLQYDLKYMKHPNRGPGYTQNRGIREARAPIVCLIADDIHLVPAALEAHIKDHELNPEPNIAILGNVLQSPALSKRSVFQAKWDPFKFFELENLRELPYYKFWACNISVKKDFLLENGLFQERIGAAGAAAHEDVELGYRLSKKGLRILFNKKALGYHYHFETLDSAIQRFYQRGLNWKQFRKQVNEPEITVAYKILNLNTIKDYIYTFRKPNNLININKTPFMLILRLLLRRSLFNFVTIYLFWIPTANKAEGNPILARCMHSVFYRCIVGYFFYKGVTYGNKCRFGG